MAEQMNLVGGGDLSPHSLNQGQGYSLGGIDDLDIDRITSGGMGDPSQHISAGDRPGESLDNLAPIFPPQTFEVPDISFSNSVSPNAEFNQSLLSSAQIYGSSGSLYTASGHALGRPGGINQQNQGHSGKGSPPMTGSSPHHVAYFPPASSSPPGTSSSDDSDDLPLAQLAKRAMAGSAASNAGASASIPSPSAHSTDTTSMEGSPTSAGVSKKAKQSKRKKKKDPNEPQKPVSAYALFFRDTQATIKGHNPSASFGEISKIVASMWDQLDPEHKDVYRKKTEMAKKQYLKQLAAYRASQVSQSAAEDIEKSPSPPGLGIMSTGVMPAMNFQTVGPAPGMAVQMTGQQGPFSQQRSPPQMVQHQPMQQHLLQQQSQVNMNQASQSPPSHQQHSPSHQMTAISGPLYSSPGHLAQTAPASYQPNMLDHDNGFGFSEQEATMEVGYPQCVRNGCQNHARENPAWDSEYCSNDCVITHCRDIFKNWVASRSGSNSYPIK